MLETMLMLALLLPMLRRGKQHSGRKDSPCGRRSRQHPLLRGLDNGIAVRMSSKVLEVDDPVVQHPTCPSTCIIKGHNLNMLTLHCLQSTAIPVRMICAGLFA